MQRRRPVGSITIAIVRDQVKPRRTLARTKENRYSCQCSVSTKDRHVRVGYHMSESRTVRIKKEDSLLYSNIHSHSEF
jgi:hypothetical protein